LLALCLLIWQKAQILSTFLKEATQVFAEIGGGSRISSFLATHGGGIGANKLGKPRLGPPTLFSFPFQDLISSFAH